MSVAPEIEGLSSEQLWDRARMSLAGGISHQSRFLPPYPAYINKARGARKWDVEGRQYIDYAMGSAAMMLGHAHADVVNAIKEQVDDGTFYATVHPLEIRWAELIQALIPSAERVRFVSSGTEATLLAIRLARAYSKRPKIIRFEGHFHGWHDYVAYGMDAPYDQPAGHGVPEAVGETVVVCKQDIQQVEERLRTDAQIGAVICEVSGANWSCVPIRDEFLHELRRVTERYGCVLIFDEVITGFRWSPGGKQALLGIKPDITTMAKIVTGGMPGGAVGGKAEIMRLLDPTVEWDGKKPGVVHKGTFNGNPLVSAAAVAALKVIETGKPQETANRVAARIREGLQRVLDEHQVDALAYGESSTFHVYFGKGARSKDIREVSPADIRSMKRDALDVYMNGLRKRGVDFMSYTGGVTSLAHTDDDVEPTLEAFAGALEDLIAAGKVGRV